MIKKHLPIPLFKNADHPIIPLLRVAVHSSWTRLGRSPTLHFWEKIWHNFLAPWIYPTAVFLLRQPPTLKLFLPPSTCALLQRTPGQTVQESPPSSAWPIVLWPPLWAAASTMTIVTGPSSPSLRVARYTLKIISLYFLPILWYIIWDFEILSKAFH